MTLRGKNRTSNCSRALSFSCCHAVKRVCRTARLVRHALAEQHMSRLGCSLRHGKIRITTAVIHVFFTLRGGAPGLGKTPRRSLRGLGCQDL